MQNQLSEASSPYLLQHKDNPVHWQLWGPETLSLAQALNRPILLSIGYAACHWCHVMAHESFEDSALAAIINEHFVPIKLDREERPDIDQIYMSALQAMGEQGGWPLTMILTPQAEAFWGGTYFPPEPRFGRPSFAQVLLALARVWQDDKPSVAKNTAAILDVLVAAAEPTPGDAPGPSTLNLIRSDFLRAQDWSRGGFGTAPKFPNMPIYRFLWQEAFRTADARAGEAVNLLLTSMSQGGIYDHLGGGYARYATDDAWLIPHFEKMLYDNALTLELLALSHAHTPNPLYAARAAETIAWLTRDMGTEGAFAASEDADSEGEEGKFYVWTRAEIAEILGPDTAFFAAHYPLPEAGNWERKIILERTAPFSAEDRLAPLREKLLHARATRIRPNRDDKILADWNALTITALVRASFAFAQPGWLALAESVFDTILNTMGQADGRIAHAMRQGKIFAPGLLEDQAAMLRAALHLYQATGSETRLQQSENILAATEQFFADGQGNFHMTAADATDIFAPRSRHMQDGPTPSGIGLMAQNYALLHHLTGAPEYRTKAAALLAAYGGNPARLNAAPTLLAAADILENATCIVLTANDPGLTAAALSAPDPAAVVLQTSGKTLNSSHPAYGKSSPVPAAFICRGGTCSLPVTTPDALRALLRPGFSPP